MKVLVAVKRVIDYNVRPRVKAGVHDAALVEAGVHAGEAGGAAGGVGRKKETSESGAECAVLLRAREATGRRRKDGRIVRREAA